jgi:nucleoporin NUP159
MLRTRNLGPEHLEKQTRLRKQVRVGVCVSCQFTLSHVPQSIRDRVEKLESHLQAAKKKLEREKSGKVGFK